MSKGLIKYWMVWRTTTILSVQTSLENRMSAGFFITGKLLRFIFFIGFLWLLGSEFDTIGGYSGEQLLVFFLVFNLLDLFGQLFFRGIYFFRQQIVSGEFDFRLAKPMSALFQALTRHTDILDLPLLIIVLFMLSRYDFNLTAEHWLGVIFMFFLAFIIITAIHIIVASLGVITTEVDHTIMIYRDFSSMARFPVDIYHQFIRGLLTFVIPVAIAYTLPAKALYGLLTPSMLFVASAISTAFLLLAVRFWRYALSQYSSASS